MIYCRWTTMIQLILLFFASFHATCGSDPASYEAVAYLFQAGVYDRQDQSMLKIGMDGLVGVVHFSQDPTTLNSTVRVFGQIFSWPSNVEVNTGVGFHVHQYGSLSGRCAAAGDHYNPANVSHGGPNDTIRHAGDFGNLVRNIDGTGSFNFTDPVVQLTGPRTIVGRSVVIHSRMDDLGRTLNDSMSRINGNSGERFACGVIGLANEFPYGGGGFFTAPTRSLTVFFIFTVLYGTVKLP